MNDLKKLLIFSKLNKLKILIDDKELSILLDKYKIVSSEKKMDVIFTCKVCKKDFTEAEIFDLYWMDGKHLTKYCKKCYHKMQFENGARRTINKFIEEITNHDLDNWELTEKYHELCKESYNCITDDYLEMKYMLNNIGRKLHEIMGKKSHNFTLNNL